MSLRDEESNSLNKIRIQGMSWEAVPLNLNLFLLIEFE